MLGRWEIPAMTIEVMPLHYVTVAFRLYDAKRENQAMEAAGQHRFLYGVESWIEGVDQRLESLAEGEYLELMLESEAAAFVASKLLQQDEFSEVGKSLVLELKIVEIVKAEPKEVVQALAATVHCCDHCGDH
jgi:FKBP-type peptidyl-prolyl cis-trans isomerase 2